jgi:biopolymer transport protein ExbD
MQLPESTMGAPKTIDRHSVHVVEVRVDGSYFLDGKSVSSGKLETDLVNLYRENPKLVVDIRADKRVEFNYPFRAFDICLRNHITSISIHVAPTGTR